MWYNPKPGDLIEWRSGDLALVIKQCTTKSGDPASTFIVLDKTGVYEAGSSWVVKLHCACPYEEMIHGDL